MIIIKDANRQIPDRGWERGVDGLYVSLPVAGARYVRLPWAAQLDVSVLDGGEGMSIE